jgi:hypothetical protein
VTHDGSGLRFCRERRVGLVRRPELRLRRSAESDLVLDAAGSGLLINQALTNADARSDGGACAESQNGRFDIHLPQDRPPHRKRYRNRSSKFIHGSIGQNSRALSTLLGRARSEDQRRPASQRGVRVIWRDPDVLKKATISTA